MSPSHRVERIFVIGLLIGHIAMDIVAIDVSIVSPYDLVSMQLYKSLYVMVVTSNSGFPYKLCRIHYSSSSSNGSHYA